MMRFRVPLFILLACCVAWLGCDEQTGVDSVQGPDPSFAAGGPTPDACDLKSLPVRDYFPKAELKYVTNLMRELSDACAVGDQVTPGVGALAKGFSLLEAVEAWRADATDYGAGGEIVARVWAAMQYNGGLLVACPDCAQADVAELELVVADALEFGAFGVRGGNDGYVVSPGEYPDIWGIEPDGDVWVVPLGKALIYGVPLTFGGLEGETSLTFGYDWNVLAWYEDANLNQYLAVGTCVPSNGANLPLVSHEPPGGLATLLPKGPAPSYCGSQQVTLGSRLLNLASLALPLWPQPLNASAMVGVSGSGKAREFSPFHQYDVAPYAAVTFTPNPPEDGTVNTDLCGGGTCTTVTWLTEGYSPIASNETLRFTTEANSSSWAGVKMCVTAVGPGTETCNYAKLGAEYAEPLDVTCDGRDGATVKCTGLAVTGFKSDKTGSHRICVSGGGGDGPSGSSGLSFDACTPTFNIRP
jgi:hypothetical protein